MTVRSVLALVLALTMPACHGSIAQPGADGSADVGASDGRAEAGSPADAGASDAGDASEPPDTMAAPDSPAPPVASLQITPAQATAVAGGPTVQFTASATFSDGSTQNVTMLATWSSSDASVAAIDVATGVATPGIAGSAVITASFGGKTGSTRITVAPDELTGITVTPNPASIPSPGCDPVQMTATATYTGSTTTDVTSAATWSTSDVTIATVSPGGLVDCAPTGAGGTVTISATLFGFTGNAAAVCSPAKITGVVVTPSSATVAPGGSVQFTGSALVSDGSMCDVTHGGTWQTAVPSVATIASGWDGGGLATGVATGSTAVNLTAAGIIAAPATLDVTGGGAAPDAGGG